LPTLVISRVFPPQVGGSGRWLWELYSRFPRGEIVVAAGRSDGDTEFDKTHELPVMRLPLATQSLGIMHWRGTPEYLRAFRTLRRAAKANEISEVHAACVLPEGFLAWMLGRSLGLPYRLFVHGEELSIVAQSRELSCMVRTVLRDAAQIIANSHNTARLLRTSWLDDDARLLVLHPGVDTKTYLPVPQDAVVRRSLGWGDRRVVLTVGRLQARKGQDCLIGALSQIRRDVPDVLYSIVGDGSDRHRLEQRIGELRMQEHVVLQGTLCDQKLIAAYQQCDLFALPNREICGDFEGFGLVLLEAQACGKPVLTGDSGGTYEAVNAPDTGLIVDCADPSQIARAAVGLLTSPTRSQAMGEAGREWVCQHFDWSICVEQARRAFKSDTTERCQALIQV
jgi:phosphatidyl-myo-inositol dimannoside synthase